MEASPPTLRRSIGRSTTPSPSLRESLNGTTEEALQATTTGRCKALINLCTSLIYLLVVLFVMGFILGYHLMTWYMVPATLFTYVLPPLYHT